MYYSTTDHLTTWPAPRGRPRSVYTWCKSGVMSGEYHEEKKAMRSTRRSTLGPVSTTQGSEREKERAERTDPDWQRLPLIELLSKPRLLKDKDWRNSGQLTKSLSPHRCDAQCRWLLCQDSCLCLALILESWHSHYYAWKRDKVFVVCWCLKCPASDW